MARQGSLIAVGVSSEVPDYDFAEHVTLHLFELDDGATAYCEVPNLRGRIDLSVSVIRLGDTLRVDVNGAGKPWHLLLRGIFEADCENGALLTSVNHGTLVTPEAGICALTILTRTEVQ